jgi:hypothetical protein
LPVITRSSVVPAGAPEPLPDDCSHCGQTVRAPWSGNHRYGRHHRALMGTPYQSSGNRPRPGTLLSQPFRQGQLLALAELYGFHPVPWTHLVKVLPVLTLSAPWQRSDHQRGRRHKLLTDWARQGSLQFCSWLSGRRIILLAIVALPSITRSYHHTNANAAKLTAHTVGRPAQKGPGLPKLKTRLTNPASVWTRIMVSA